MATGPKPKHVICLSAKAYVDLKHLARLRETATHAQVVRAKIVLLAYEHPDWANATIAHKVGCTDWTVRKWRRRWKEVASIKEAPRSGAPRLFSLNPTSAGHGVGLHSA
jgi:hypothetical protein